MKQAAKFLTSDIPTAILSAIAGGYQPLTVPRQLELLTSRADAFAATGSWEQSVHLREAALVLDPRWSHSVNRSSRNRGS